MEQNSARMFSENWNVYQKMIAHNYMHHSEFAGKTAAVFASFHSKKLDILDIGCGDANALLPALHQIPVASYTGYDLSPNALELAADNLSVQGFSFTLRQGDMMALIQEEEKQFDVIHSSFAIHHLQDADKLKMLQACHDRLLPGGKMIYIDVFRQQHNSRDQYIKEYFSHIENKWTLLTPHEKQLVYDHVSQYDFPPDIDEATLWIQKAGFSVSENYQPDHRHAMMVLSKG